MPASRSDRRLLVTTSVALVVAGLLVAVAIFFATGGSEGTPKARGPLYIGTSKDLRTKIRNGGPLYFANPFAGHGFWLDVEDRELRVFALIRPGTRDCQVKWRDRRDAYVDCRGAAVPTDALDTFPVTEPTSGPRKGGVLVDLRDKIPASNAR